MLVNLLNSKLIIPLAENVNGLRRGILAVPALDLLEVSALSLVRKMNVTS